MATHYKGERIDELLERIEQLKEILDTKQMATNEKEQYQVATAYMTLALQKAKFKALQGED